MAKYINKISLIAIVIIFLALRLADFNQSMTPYWVGPYLSAAVNFDWSQFALNVNMEELLHFSQLSQSEYWRYGFNTTSDFIEYEHLPKGLMLLVMLAKNIFFFLGDLEALQYLQYLAHILLSIFMLTLFNRRYQKILFFILYAVNPLVLWVVNYPFYYFWQVIPSLIFVYWYLKKDIKLPLMVFISTILAFIYITRPSVVLLIILFYVLFAFKNNFKYALMGFVIFFSLISISPKISIGPWHTMYVGIGAYENPYGIDLSDREGYKYYKEQTGKLVNSRNITQEKVKEDYYKVLKDRYFSIVEENPVMIIKHAVLNTIQAYSIGYSHSLNQKFGNKIIYLSILIGLIFMGLLIYTKQYVLFLAIGVASGSFTLYYPPILVYMFGNFILLVVGFIGVIDYFLKHKHLKSCASVFGYQVKDPERFGGVAFDKNQKTISLEEKPKKPQSNFAVPGLYFYDNDVIEMAKKVKPSYRGELEITTLNQIYLERGDLNVELLGRGFSWPDTGTHESLLEAAMFVETIEKRQGYKIACLEEIAWNNGWITKKQLFDFGKKLEKNSYGRYLINIAEGYNKS